jgi:hypothetical protein
MVPLFGEGRTPEEPILSELLRYTAEPRPFADAAAFIALAARLPLRDWRDIILPRHLQLARTPEYQAARIELADAIDAMGYPTARDVIVSRAAEVAESLSGTRPGCRSTLARCRPAQRGERSRPRRRPRGRESESRSCR